MRLAKISAESNGWQNFVQVTERRLTKLLTQGMRHPDPKAAIREFWGAAHHLLAIHDTAMKGDGEIDNLSAWREAFSDDFAQKIKMDGKQRALPSFIKYYLGFQDPSTCAERSLGRMTKHYDQPSGPLQQDGVTLSGLLQVDLDGPQQVEDLAKRSIINEDAASRHVFLEPTTLSLGADRIWKEHHGRRFNLYKQCKDHGQKKLAKKHGTAGASRRAQGQSCWWSERKPERLKALLCLVWKESIWPPIYLRGKTRNSMRNFSTLSRRTGLGHHKSKPLSSSDGWGLNLVHFLLNDEGLPWSAASQWHHLERKSLRVVDIRVKNDARLAAPRPGQKLEVWRATTQPPVIEIAQKRSNNATWLFWTRKATCNPCPAQPREVLSFFSSHPVFRISCEPSHSHWQTGQAWLQCFKICFTHSNSSSVMALTPFAFRFRNQTRCCLVERASMEFHIGNDFMDCPGLTSRRCLLAVAFGSSLIECSAWEAKGACILQKPCLERCANFIAESPFRQKHIGTTSLLSKLTSLPLGLWFLTWKNKRSSSSNNPATWIYFFLSLGLPFHFLRGGASTYKQREDSKWVLSTTRSKQGSQRRIASAADVFGAAVKLRRLDQPKGLQTGWTKRGLNHSFWDHDGLRCFLVRSLFKQWDGNVCAERFVVDRVYLWFCSDFPELYEALWPCYFPDEHEQFFLIVLPDIKEALVSHKKNKTNLEVIHDENNVSTCKGGSSRVWTQLLAGEAQIDQRVDKNHRRMAAGKRVART